MDCTDRLLSFEFIDRTLNADATRLQTFRVNQAGQREAWLSDLVRDVRPDARRFAGWVSRIEAAELIAKG